MKFKFKIDAKFYKALFALSLPIALQSLLASSLNMLDMVMVGRLGEVSIAAVGLANQYFFVAMLLMFGVTSGANIFIAQYWGKKNFSKIAQAMGTGIIFSLAVAAIFAIASVIFPTQIMQVFSNDPRVVETGVEFIVLASLSLIPFTITNTYAGALRSTGNVKLPMFTGVVALAVNTVLNYILIFGNFGFPAMGVRGAALATLLSRIFEMVLILLLVYKKQHEFILPFKKLFAISKSFIKDFLKTSLPVVLNEGLWSTGVTIIAIIYSRMGTEDIAAINIVGNIERLATFFMFGLGSAAAIMIGNSIGEGKYNEAKRIANKFQIITPLSGVAVCSLLFFLIPVALSFYNVSATVMQLSYNVLIIAVIVFPIKMYNCVAVIGILRGGGDTKIAMYIDLLCMYFLAVPLALIGVFVFHFPLEVVYAMVLLDEVVKVFVLIFRLNRGKWINDLTIRKKNIHA
jgi:putative MATE family efflux protein